jgi:hypothetical protein
MRVAQSAVVGCTAGAAWNAAAVEAKKTIDARIIQATAALPAACVTAPSVLFSVVDDHSVPVFLC